MLESMPVKTIIKHPYFMKTFLTSKTIVALAVALAASAANVVNAYEQPIPPPASVSDLPANIVPGSDLAQVFKLVQANVQLEVVKNFIANSTSRFDLDASKIIALSDAGLPGNILDAMLEHDRQIVAVAQTPPPAPASPPTVVETISTTPPPPVTVNYFYDTLTPYGNWVEVAGYGRCWRPTTVVYDSDWHPYRDRGHWVYTDCGWYWDSDYAWGTTFHYGRWFRDTRFGWCWWPDTTWAPSWVLWRSGQDACGWAPLPPRCFYRQDHGFLYNGNNITVGFDFGLGESYFSFVSYNHFFDRRLRDRCEDSRRVRQFYHNTTIVNNYNFNNSHHAIANNGISIDRFAAATHHPVQAVAVNNLPNATRHGWRGEGRVERGSGNSNHSPANHTGYDQSGSTPRNANAGGNVGAPVIIDGNGQRGHGNALGNSGTRTGNPVANPPSGGKVYTQEPAQATTRQIGAPVGQQNQNAQPNLGNNRGQHSSRLDQQQTRGQNQPTTPALTTTPPPRTTLPVQQPQVIRPQTPAQNGQVLDRNNQSSRLEQQRNLATAVINTTPPQRSELQVQQPQIIRPSVPNTVLQPSSGYMQQRVQQQQMENRINETRNSVQRPANNYQPPAPSAPQRAPDPAGRPSSDNRKSDRDKKP